MYKHRISDQVGLKTYFDWFLLAFLAGSVNAGGFLSCHRFVSHVTGLWTLVGVNLSLEQWSEAVGMLTIPVYFLFGAMLAAFFIEGHGRGGKTPRFGLVMGAVATLLFLAALGGYCGFFGSFGNESELSQDYLLIALLCSASGLQNAALTSATGHTVRTTHLTGVTTDLGIGIIRQATLKKHDQAWAKERKANWLRFGTISAFTLGAFFGGILFNQFQYLGFLLPASIAVYAAAVALRDT